MGIEETRTRMERDVRSLVHRRLVAVAYYEVAWDSDVVLWNREPDFDTIDFGVELRFEGGDALWISWADDFYHYALHIEMNATDDRSHMRERNVSESSRWKVLLGREIEVATIYWDWQQRQGHDRRWGPQDLELTFDGGEVVYLSSLWVEADKDPHGHVDMVTVCFDRTVAERYPVGPFATDVYLAPAGSSANGLIG